MVREIGQRVGVVSHADRETVYLFGFGVYEGDHIPPDNIGIGIPNPRIKLDSGKEVYGCECWWGSEKQINEMIADRKVVDVDIDEARSKTSVPEA